RFFGNFRYETRLHCQDASYAGRCTALLGRWTWRATLPDVARFLTTPRRPNDPQQTEPRTQQASPERAVVRIQARKRRRDQFAGQLLRVAGHVRTLWLTSSVHTA